MEKWIWERKEPNSIIGGGGEGGRIPHFKEWKNA